MSNFSKEMIDEAQRRMNYMVDTYGLNPHLSKYLEEGKLYYSYLTCGGVMGAIDTISYDPRYETVVRDFERKYGGYVYHCIESMGLLVLLYVGKDAKEWSCDFAEHTIPQGTCICTMAYVYNFDMNFGEFGDVYLAGAKDITGNVVLIRMA